MKTQRYRFEKQLENATLDGTAWLFAEYKKILELDKDYTRKADYIGFSLLSLDDKIAGIDEELAELKTIKQNLKKAKEIALEVGAEVFESFGVDKIEGVGISSITITPKTIKQKIELVIFDERALIMEGYFKVVLDEDAIKEAYAKADERAKLMAYCDAKIVSEADPAKLRVNKKRGYTKADAILEDLKEVA